jgi:hypothetical protein
MSPEVRRRLCLCAGHISRAYLATRGDSRRTRGGLAAKGTTPIKHRVSVDSDPWTRGGLAAGLFREAWSANEKGGWQMCLNIGASQWNKTETRYLNIGGPLAKKNELETSTYPYILYMRYPPGRRSGTSE